MKLKKTIISIFSVLTLSLTSFSVSAENMTILNDEEIKGVISAIEKENALIAQGVEYSIVTDPDVEDVDINAFLSINGYDIEKAYKTYTIEELIITKYKETSDFKTLVTEDLRFKIPAEGKLAIITNRENEGYKVIGKVHSDDMPDYKSITEEIFKNINEEIITVINAESFLYNMNIIYVETKENEYAAPFFDELLSDSYGDRLVNGTIYSVAEFMDRMDQIYDEENFAKQAYDENGEPLCGGVPLKAYAPYVPSFSENVAAQSKNISVKDGSDTFKFIVVGVGVGISVIFLATFIILTKKKKPEK